MVATVTIEEVNGGTDGNPGAHTRVDGQNHGNGVDVDVRFATMDAYNPVAQNPCIIPSSGDQYSFWKHLHLAIANGTGFTKINNIKFYSDGGIGWNCGTGGGLFVGLRDAGDNGCPMDTEYDVATGSVNTTGDWMDDVTSGHGYYNGQTANPASVADYTSGAPLEIDTTDHSAAGNAKAVVLQCKIHDDAIQGDQSTETLTMVYDEI